MKNSANLIGLCRAAFRLRRASARLNPPLLAIALCAILTAQNSTIEQAWKLAAKGDRVRAEQILQNLMQSQPSNADAHLLLGSLLAEDGNRDAAIEQLQSAVQLRPKSAEAWNTLGEIYRQFDEKLHARGAFTKAVAADPNNGIAQSNLGAVLLTGGESGQAVPHLDRAITLLKRPADAAEAHYLRARIDMNSGHAGDAARHLEKAVALHPDFAEAWSDLGQARKTLLNEPGALQAFEQAVKLNPQDAVAQYRLGTEYMRQERSAQALPPLEAAYRLNGEDQSVLNALAAALRQAGRKEEANQIRRKLTEAIHKRDLASQSALNALKLNNDGVEFEKSGKLTEAMDCYRRAVALNPDHAGMRVNYAVVLLRLGRWREGLDEMHTALERDPDNEKIQSALKDALSQAPKDAIPEWAQTRQNQFLR